MFDTKAEHSKMVSCCVSNTETQHNEAQNSWVNNISLFNQELFAHHECSLQPTGCQSHSVKIN